MENIQWRGLSNFDQEKLIHEWVSEKQKHDQNEK